MKENNIKENKYKAIVEKVILDQTSKLPVVSLRLVNTNKILPIYVGLLEASSIVYAIQKVKFDRPMTHDLFTIFAKQLDISVAKAELVDIIQNTYYSKIHFILKDGILDIDARPSDAIAIALRFNAPIFVHEKVIDKTNVADKYEAFDKSQEGERWTQYLETLPNDKFLKI